MGANERDQFLDALDAGMAAVDPRLQEYVDRTLEEKEALRLHLRAQADAGLAARLDATRSFFAALDGMERAEPSPSFDARILASLPLEHYRSAPRRSAPVLVLGDLAPSAWWVALRSAGRGAMAIAGAYLLTLVVANSALQSVISAAALRVDHALTAAAQRTDAAGPWSSLVGALARGYDALLGAASGVVSAVGPSAAVFTLGAVVGIMALASMAAWRRRHPGHSASA